jgi:hypothetical protein
MTLRRPRRRITKLPSYRKIAVALFDRLSFSIRLSISPSECRQCLSSRKARSSWFRHMPARLATKASTTSETLEPTQTPSGGQIPQRSPTAITHDWSALLERVS